ncbi:unnamed protein product [Staurois parvus]|uniref:Uncharacterized protein n=1 Tax=Staurois parvus TaxID=386267 RepID=A0ABN9FNU8_9NEOB|nr:unnamed protein product [Staurois parvus]
MYIHRNTHTQTHVHTYTDTCTHRHVHTYTQTHTHIHVHTHRHMYRYTHVHTHRHMYNCTCIHTHMYTYTHTHTPIKSCSTSLFTHRSGHCTLEGGREHGTHSFLCFHCAQLLSSLTAPSANDRSGLSSEPAQQDGPGGHTRPHYNFPLAIGVQASGNFKP